MKLGRGRTPADGSWGLLLRRCSPEVTRTEQHCLLVNVRDGIGRCPRGQALWLSSNWLAVDGVQTAIVV